MDDGWINGGTDTFLRDWQGGGVVTRKDGSKTGIRILCALQPTSVRLSLTACF